VADALDLFDQQVDPFGRPVRTAGRVECKDLGFPGPDRAGEPSALARGVGAAGAVQPRRAEPRRLPVGGVGRFVLGGRRGCTPRNGSRHPNSKSRGRNACRSLEAVSAASVVGRSADLAGVDGGRIGRAPADTSPNTDPQSAAAAWAVSSATASALCRVDASDASALVVGRGGDDDR